MWWTMGEIFTVAVSVTDEGRRATSVTVEYWFEAGRWLARTEHRKVTVAAESRFSACLLAAAAYFEWLDNRRLPCVVG